MNGGKEVGGNCPSCGHVRTPDAVFCEKCGAHFSGGQQPTATGGGASHIEANLRKFRARLTAVCPYCRYQGLMGWDDFHFPVRKAIWMPVALLLCLLGVIPGLIVFLVVQRGKRYAAVCPNCEKPLLLKMSEAQPVKSAWGGAQFFDANGQKVPGSKLLARAGKWVLIGAVGLIGLFVILSAAGMLIEKAGWKAFNAREPSSENTAPPAGSTAGAVASSDGTREGPLVAAVRNGTIEEYPAVPIGKAFEVTFDNPQWRSGESEKGVKFVEFNGRLKSSKYKAVFEKALSEYSNCAAEVDEVRKMPNYSFVKYAAGLNSTYGTDALKMAQENKGNEDRIAELFNSSDAMGVTRLAGRVDEALKIGPGNREFDEFVKDYGDIKICGPGTEEELAAVKFQFQFTADATSFSLTYIDLQPWSGIGISGRESVLQYVFQ
jgi:hypothetical protein